MKKIYYLKTCTTCKRILKTLNAPSDYILQDIKTEAITIKQLDYMCYLAGSYEALFSKRSNRYKEMDLKLKTLEERDYKHYILDHYTFLNRPVIIVEDHIFIGSAQSTVEAAKAAIHSKQNNQEALQL